MKVRVPTLVTVFTLAMLLASCAQEATVGKPPSTDGPTMTVSQAVDPATFGRTVRVQGTVHRVCQQEGCWMSITDGESYLRMTFTEMTTIVPTDLSGEVIVEGVVREDVYEEEDARAIGASIGMTDDEIAALQGDQRIPMMTSTGVLFLDHRP